MSARTLLIIAGCGLLWALSGLFLGVQGVGLLALWAGAMLSLMLGVAAWCALTSPDRWAGSALAAVALTSLAAFALFVVVKQMTHHRPLGAATMAVCLSLVFAAVLPVAWRVKVRPSIAYSLVALSFAFGVASGAVAFDWQVWMQLALGAALVGVCVYAQRQGGETAEPGWSTWVVFGIVTLNLAFLVIGLPPSVQEAAVVLGLLGVLS